MLRLNFRRPQNEDIVDPPAMWDLRPIEVGSKHLRELVRPPRAHPPAKRHSQNLECAGSDPKTHPALQVPPDLEVMEKTFDVQFYGPREFGVGEDIQHLCPSFPFVVGNPLAVV